MFLFTDERVDDDVLKILDDESIRQLIPTIGHRMKFKEALKSWKLQNESVSLSTYLLFVWHILTVLSQGLIDGSSLVLHLASSAVTCRVLRH